MTHQIFVAGRPLNESELAIQWRNTELLNTDWVVPTTDHPQHAEYLTYRQALRDWPASVDFPTTRPAL
jgi:hypothetical protein